MASICPECGAVHNKAASCQEILDAFLAQEFTDPGYGAVHFLTVACFMIQHRRYSDSGMAWIADKLRLYLEHGMTADQIRQQAAKEAAPAQRKWKVTRAPDAPPLPEVAWSMTIADVAAQYQDAESYRTLIEQWARATLREMQPFLRGS